LSVVYSTECKAANKPSRPGSMLPILVFLFIVSYALLTMLVFEQGRTIESQRGLIRAMLQDSTQLAALKSKIAQGQSQHAQDKSPPDPNNPNPAGSNGAASKSADPNANKDAKRAGKHPHSMKQSPGVPPSDLEDVRRATHTI